MPKITYQTSLMFRYIQQVYQKPCLVGTWSADVFVFFVKFISLSVIMKYLYIVGWLGCKISFLNKVWWFIVPMWFPTRIAWRRGPYFLRKGTRLGNPDPSAWPTHPAHEHWPCDDFCRPPKRLVWLEHVDGRLQLLCTSRVNHLDLGMCHPFE